MHAWDFRAIKICYREKMCAYDFRARKVSQGENSVHSPLQLLKSLEVKVKRYVYRLLELLKSAKVKVKTCVHGPLELLKSA